MFRFAFAVLLTLIAVAFLSCQTYSTGVQQSLGRADETAAVAALHAIAIAEETYSLTNGGKYASMDQLRDGGFLDVRFKAADGGVKNYSLTIITKPESVGVPTSFSCNADPANTGPQAGRHFYVDSTSATVHVNATQPATAADPNY